METLYSQILPENTDKQFVNAVEDMARKMSSRWPIAEVWIYPNNGFLLRYYTDTGRVNITPTRVYPNKSGITQLEREQIDSVRKDLLMNLNYIASKCKRKGYPPPDHEVWVKDILGEFDGELWHVLIRPAVKGRKREHVCIFTPEAADSCPSFRTNIDDGKMYESSTIKELKRTRPTIHRALVEYLSVREGRILMNDDREYLSSEQHSKVECHRKGWKSPLLKKVRKGNPPQQKGWALWRRLLDAGHEWHVYSKQNDVEGWLNLKIIASGPLKGKANYWLSYNTTTNKIHKSADAKLLNEERTGLYDQLVTTLKGKYHA